MYEWIDDLNLTVAGTRFRLLGTGATESNSFSLFKPKRLVERYLLHADEFQGGRIFEAGIYKGGSTAFLTALLNPERLVAIDLDTTGNPRLDRWLTEHGLAENVRLHYGIDQADHAAILSILAGDLDNEPLDLVIDDASHLLTPTTTTFNLLFPRLRTGGLYVIEDWSARLVMRAAMLENPEILEARVRSDPERMKAKLRSNPEILEARLQSDPKFLKQFLEKHGDRLAAAASEQDDPDSENHAKDLRGSPPQPNSADGFSSAVGDQATPTRPATTDGPDESEMWRLPLQMMLAVGAKGNLFAEMFVSRGYVGIRRGPEYIDSESFNLNSYLTDSPA